MIDRFVRFVKIRLRVARFEGPEREELSVDKSYLSTSGLLKSQTTIPFSIVFSDEFHSYQSGKFGLCNRDLGCTVLMFSIYFKVNFRNLGRAICKLSSQALLVHPTSSHYPFQRPLWCRSSISHNRYHKILLLTSERMHHREMIVSYLNLIIAPCVNDKHTMMVEAKDIINQFLFNSSARYYIFSIFVFRIFLGNSMVRICTLSLLSSHFFSGWTNLVCCYIL